VSEKVEGVIGSRRGGELNEAYKLKPQQIK